MRQLADISHWAGDVDFNIMKSAGISGVIMKAGQGNWIDRRFKGHQKDSRGVLPRGAYWFFDSKYIPAIQAEAFIDALGDDKMELPLFVDYEENYGGDYGGWRALSAMIIKLEELAPEKEIIIYSNYYYWQANSPAWWQPAQMAWFKNYRFWMAAYNTRPVDDQRIPAPWTEMILWQYTQSGDGDTYGVEALDIDLNKFVGDEDDWLAFIDDVAYPPDEPDPPTPPTGEDEMIVAELKRIADNTERIAEVAEASGSIVTPPSVDPPAPEWPKYKTLVPKSNGITELMRIPDINSNDNKYLLTCALGGTPIKEYMPPKSVYPDGGPTIWRTDAELARVLHYFACVKMSDVIINIGGVPTALLEFKRNKPEGASFGEYGFIQREFIK